MATDELTVEAELEVVVRRAECGCFAKFYFELDGALPTDSEVEQCKRHADYAIVAGTAARKKADEIRARMKRG